MELPGDHVGLLLEQQPKELGAGSSGADVPPQGVDVHIRYGRPMVLSQVRFGAVQKIVYHGAADVGGPRINRHRSLSLLASLA